MTIAPSLHKLYDTFVVNVTEGAGGVDLLTETIRNAIAAEPKSFLYVCDLLLVHQGVNLLDAPVTGTVKFLPSATQNVATTPFSFDEDSNLADPYTIREIPLSSGFKLQTSVVGGVKVAVNLNIRCLGNAALR